CAKAVAANGLTTITMCSTASDIGCMMHPGAVVGDHAACVLLRSASGPADHFGDEILTACRGHAMVGLVAYWVCIQAGINHDPVDEIINQGGDAIDTAEPIVQGGCVLHSHLCSSSFRFPRLVLAPIDWIFK